MKRSFTDIDPTPLPEQTRVSCKITNEASFAAWCEKWVPVEKTCGRSMEEREDPLRKVFTSEPEPIQTIERYAYNILEQEGVVFSFADFAKMETYESIQSTLAYVSDEKKKEEASLTEIHDQMKEYFTGPVQFDTIQTLSMKFTSTLKYIKDLSNNEEELNGELKSVRTLYEAAKKFFGGKVKLAALVADHVLADEYLDAKKKLDGLDTKLNLDIVRVNPLRNKLATRISSEQKLLVLGSADAWEGCECHVLLQSKDKDFWWVAIPNGFKDHVLCRAHFKRLFTSQ